MIYRVLADLVVIIHLLFIVFALMGALLVIWRGFMVFIHIPAAIWVSVISFKGWVCPLTPLENHLRIAAGSEGYTGGFVEHYLIPVIYPANLTLNHQVVLGFIAIAINAGLYSLVFYRYKLRKLK